MRRSRWAARPTASHSIRAARMPRDPAASRADAFLVDFRFARSMRRRPSCHVRSRCAVFDAALAHEQALPALAELAVWLGVSEATLRRRLRPKAAAITCCGSNASPRPRAAACASRTGRSRGSPRISGSAARKPSAARSSGGRVSHRAGTGAIASRTPRHFVRHETRDRRMKERISESFCASMTFFASGAARQLTRRSTRHYPCALMVPRDGTKGTQERQRLESAAAPATERRIRATACHWETGKAGTNQDPRARRPAIDPRSKQPHRAGCPDAPTPPWRCLLVRTARPQDPPDVHCYRIRFLTGSVAPAHRRHARPACSRAPFSIDRVRRHVPRRRPRLRPARPARAIARLPITKPALPAALPDRRMRSPTTTTAP